MKIPTGILSFVLLAFLAGGEGSGEVSMVDHAGLKFHGKASGLKA
jgi:hypothetical protein